MLKNAENNVSKKMLEQSKYGVMVNNSQKVWKPHNDYKQIFLNNVGAQCKKKKKNLKVLQKSLKILNVTNALAQYYKILMGKKSKNFEMFDKREKVLRNMVNVEIKIKNSFITIYICIVCINKHTTGNSVTSKRIYVTKSHRFLYLPWIWQRRLMCLLLNMTSRLFQDLK